MALLEVDDLTPFVTIDNEDKAEAMIADAVASATISAPCLADPDVLSDVQLAAFKSVLRGAVLRWLDAGSGAFASQTAGPFGQTLDTRQPRRSMFTAAEKTELRRICKAGSAVDGGAFSVDTAAPPMTFRSVLDSSNGMVGAIAFDTDEWPLT